MKNSITRCKTLRNNEPTSGTATKTKLLKRLIHLDFKNTKTGEMYKCEEILPRDMSKKLKIYSKNMNRS